MAKIKYDPLVNPLQNEHYGFTFQRNNYGFSMFPASKSGRKRYPLQWEKMQYMSKAIRQWRNMSLTTINAWNVFASTFPQPTEKNPDEFLTGYQLFLKRNFYRFLHEGINFDFLLDPQLTELPTPDFSIEIIEKGLCVDVTEHYIRNFGLLPAAGQFIICRVIPIATDSGQFFAPFVATLEVQEVYIDGLVCSFNFPAVVENIVFSLYMSKPVWESVQYPGTKFRYMGCFKPTKFIQLTDTPESYTDQAGKIVSVKEDETGLEFTEPAGCDYCLPDPATGAPGESVQVNPAGDGYELTESSGGGLSCDDLLNCEIIQTISDAVAATGKTSVPAVNFGICYSTYCLYNSMAIVPDGWHIPTRANWESFISYILTLGTPMNLILEPNLSYWNTVPGTWSNQQKFNGRGTGYMDGLHATALNFKEMAAFWTSTAAYSIKYYSVRFSFSQPNGQFTSNVYTFWVPIRFVKDSTSLQNGESGVFISWSGKRYRTICINGMEYMADNLNETTLPDGSEIEVITNPSSARYLNYPTICFPDLNENNR